MRNSAASTRAADSPTLTASGTRAVWLGTLLMLVIIVSLIAPRAIPYAFLILLVASLGNGVARDGLKALAVGINDALFALSAFLLYAAASMLWAVAPRITLQKTLLAAAVVLGTAAVVRRVTTAPRSLLVHLSRGLWTGLLIGLSYLLIEILSGFVITRWVINLTGLANLSPPRFYKWQGSSLAGMVPEYVTRNITPVTPLLWPAVMAALYEARPPWNRVIAGTLYALAFLVVMLSPHETSKVAIVAGTTAFLLTRRWPWLARPLIPLSWCAACLLVVPLALLAHNADLHESTWLQPSARERIVIWRTTAEDSLAHPVLGVGAAMTYVLGPDKQSRSAAAAYDDVRELSRHAHNVYLQTWFELGLMGAILLTLAGLCLLRTIARLDPGTHAFGYATFASIAAVIASSYGMWQTWFLATFGLAVTAFTVGVQCLTTGAGRSEP